MNQTPLLLKYQIKVDVNRNRDPQDESPIEFEISDADLDNRLFAIFD